MSEYPKKIRIDPVCRREVPGKSNIPTVVFGEKTYHFCTESCRAAFVSNPHHYLVSNPVKRKGLWGRYLDRVNKATGGKPPCCH